MQMFSTEALVSNFSKRYKLILLIIATFVSVSLYLLTLQQDKQKNFSEIINIAGQQRMLSQRIALSVNQMRFNEAEHQSNTAQLLQDTDKILSNHYFLEQQSTLFDQQTQDDLSTAYNGDNGLSKALYQYAQAVNTFVKTGQLEQDAILFSSTNTNQLLSRLDSVVKQLESAVNREYQALRNQIYLAWLAIMLCLLALAVVVLKPTKNWLATTYGKLLNERNSVNDIKFAINKHSVVMRVNSNTEIVYCNKMFSKQYGYSEQEVINKPIKLLRSNFHEQSYYNTINEALTNRTIWHGEVCNKAKDGRQYWFNTTIVPLRATNKEAASSIIIQNNMYSELSGDEEGLVGYWNFNEGEGTTIYDHSGNGNHGTIHGATWVERE